MDYAIYLLEEKAMKFEKSKDNLKATFERAEEYLRSGSGDEESRQMIEEFVSSYQNENKSMCDKLDSLYSAIYYLKKRGGEDT